MDADEDIGLEIAEENILDSINCLETSQTKVKANLDNTDNSNILTNEDYLSGIFRTSEMKRGKLRGQNSD